MSRCHARQEADQYVCVPCGLVWDMNDPEPPACRLGVSGEALEELALKAPVTAEAIRTGTTPPCPPPPEAVPYHMESRRPNPSKLPRDPNKPGNYSPRQRGQSALREQSWRKPERHELAARLRRALVAQARNNANPIAIGLTPNFVRDLIRELENPK